MSVSIEIIKGRIKNFHWTFKYFGYLLIIALSAHAATNYYIDPPSNREFHYIIDRIFILIGFFILLFGAIIREILIRRRAKYASVTNHIHSICHNLRDLTTFIENALNNHSDCKVEGCERCLQRKEDALNAIKIVLDEFKNCFSMLTGVNCRSSIKFIFTHNGRAYVYTLARDNASSKINHRKDKERLDSKIDSIEKNFDFSMLAKDDPEERWFFANDLTRLRHYATSSFDCYGHPTQDIKWYNHLVDAHWTLPYRSTIVWPIRQAGSSGNLKFKAIGCIGFLTIDSDSRNVFDRRWDGPLGAAIADALFHPLTLYVKLTKSTHRID